MKLCVCFKSSNLIKIKNWFLNLSIDLMTFFAGIFTRMYHLSFWIGTQGMIQQEETKGGSSAYNDGAARAAPVTRPIAIESFSFF